jgi:helix-turn-helix protein
MPDNRETPGFPTASDPAFLSTEAVRLFQWRRIVLEGDGPGLTLAEAAAILGLSVGSVARRVKSGEIRAFRDQHGRLRISPTFDGTPPNELTKLWEEYKATRDQLEAASKERAGIARELAEAQEALGHSQRELSAMWRLLRSRSPAIETLDEAPEEDHPHGIQTPEAARIQGQIADIREWARRRSRHWTRAS